MPKYSKAAYAERVGVSRAWIDKLIKRKTNNIVLILDGKNKVIESDQADPIVKYKPAGRTVSKTAQINGGKGKGKGNNISDLSTLETVDIALKAEKLKTQKIKNEKDNKELVNFDETSSTVFNFLRPLRDDLLEIAKRISPMVHVAGSKLEAEKFISKEIERVMLSRLGGDYKFDEELKKKVIKILKM